MIACTKTLFVLCCLGHVTFIHAALKLSNFVTPCSLKDPNLNDCMMTKAKALLPHLIAGVKEWGILPMDPLAVPHMSLSQAISGFSLNATDTLHYGWKEMSVDSIRMNPTTYEIELKARTPGYQVLGMYAVTGKILLLPIQGSGHLNITFQNSKITMVLNFAQETRGGKTFLKLAKTTCDASVTNVIYQMDNLFGNKQLSDAMNNILTENSVEVFKDFKEPVENLYIDIFQEILNRMFAKVPLNQLFED